MTLDGEGDVATILSEFGGDPQRAEGLATFLGFEPVPNPEDRLAGPLSGGLKQFLRGRDDRGFGVSELYRVGHRKAAPAEAGLWVAVLSDWGYRSSDRDRSRRRMARALVEYVADSRRSLALLVPPLTDRRGEAELIFPRLQTGTRGGVTTIRAHLDLNSRHALPPGAASRATHSPDRRERCSKSPRKWQQQFSVERVTTKFYQEYAAVRDRIADALLAHNQDHPVVGDFTQDEACAWATRQMGRVLFIWFLQAKGWLGEPGGHGSVTYLLDLWKKCQDSVEGEYYRGILEPLFFDALATGSSSRGEHSELGYVPYLNGGLFRRSAIEDRIDDAGPVTLPDEVFDPEGDNSLLALLSQYRFVTRESTPDDQSVDPDPELLGRVFENLYQGDERHDSGTYYTPREIVHFMCREALDGYLRDETGVEQGTLNALRQEAVGSRDEHQSMPNVPAEALINALETVRVCDPAVGSGAFLLGAIQEIVALRRGILFSQKRYVEHDRLYEMVSEWKRRAIEYSLFGVDNNAEAVEICRLRLWLSMVLDMDEPPTSDSNWALPNLDFQIVAGDSLVDRMAGVTFKESWPPPDGLQLDMELERRLRRLESNIAQRRAEFASTHRNPKRLRELRGLIARDQREIICLHLEDARDKAEAEVNALNERKKPPKRALKMARERADRMSALLADVEDTDFPLVQKPFFWPVAFPDVLRERDPDAGFDIVLANPPYVKHEKLDAEDQNSYAEAFPKVHAGTADLLVYFYARAVQILRPGGWLSFITSNKYMRAAYGAGVREHLPASLRIRRVVDFGDLPLFDANGKPIAAYPAVLVGSRSVDSAGHALAVADLSGPTRKQLRQAKLKVNPENVRGALENLDALLDGVEHSEYPQVLLRKNGWILEDPTLIRLFERLMNYGTPLGEFVEGRLYYGIKTGLNEAFVIDQNKRDELIEEEPRSAELIKPWLRGKDIKRWRAVGSGQYVIAIQNSGDDGADNPWADAGSEAAARDVFKTTYPAVHDHLSWFEPKLRRRQDQGKFWWELRSCTYYHEFANSKIVFNRFIDSATFAYDTSGLYHNDACYFAIPPSPSMAAIVNSTVGWWLLSQLCTALQNGYLQVFVQFLEQLPIPHLSADIDQALSQLVETLASGASAPDIESEIDSLVFHAYGLSASERKLLLDWLGERREALGVAQPANWRQLNALRATAGAWRGNVDSDQLMEDVYASRTINTRPEPQL